MKPLYIEFVNMGVANRFDLGDYEVIEMNWRLKQYPDLFNEVIMHEVNHKEGDTTAKDLIHDMKSKTPGLFKFMLTHISSWTMVFPIYWHKKRKRIVYDWNWIVIWVMLASIIYTVFLLLDLGMFLLRRYTW